jgi:hypothetical protein
VADSPDTTIPRSLRERYLLPVLAALIAGYVLVQVTHDLASPKPPTTPRATTPHWPLMVAPGVPSCARGKPPQAIRGSQLLTGYQRSPARRLTSTSSA